MIDADWKRRAAFTLLILGWVLASCAHTVDQKTAPSGKPLLRLNVLASQGERQVPSELCEAIKRLPESEQQKVLEGYQKGVNQARQVDFLFLMKKPSESPQGCLRQELFGQPSTVSARPGSDHFGVLDTYIADSSECRRSVLTSEA